MAAGAAPLVENMNSVFASAILVVSPGACLVEAAVVVGEGVGASTAGVEAGAAGADAVVGACVAVVVSRAGAAA